MRLQAAATSTAMTKITRPARPPFCRTLTAGLPSSTDWRSKCLPSGGRMEAKGSSNLGAATGAGAGAPSEGAGAKGIGGGGGGANGLGMALGPGTG